MTATPTLSVPLSTLVSTEGLELPLRAARIEVVAGQGHARVRLLQTFVNEGEESLEVRYALPLPADAAVAGFVFVVGDERIVGEIKTREAARDAFDNAMFEGRSAALLEAVRDGQFTQRLGHVPPHSEVQVEIELDQPLQWEDGQWCWRFPTVVAPRYVDALVQDAGEVAVMVADGPLPSRLSLQLDIGDALVGPVQSPSHTVVTDGTRVRLSGGAARLDRDVVVRWPVAAVEPGLTTHFGRAAGACLAQLTLVPPVSLSRAVARDLVVLLDVSGSMGGAPLRQAVRVVNALIDGMSASDSLELLAFGGTVRQWQPRPTAMDGEGRKLARAWLTGLRAGGGTPMDKGIAAALVGIREDAQRQVLLVTDGHIGFEQRIVRLIQDGCGPQTRLHVLGVGHGVNRSLTRPAALAGRGHEEIVAPGEDVQPALARLVQRMAQPVLVDMTARSGDIVVPLPDLYQGWPSACVVPADGGELVIEGRGPDGPWRRVVPVPEKMVDRADFGRRFARQEVSRLDLRRAKGENTTAAVRTVGLRFGIATRETSFIAVSSQAAVDPIGPRRSVDVAHEMVRDMSVESVGLRAPAGASSRRKRRGGRERGAFRMRQSRRSVGKPAPPSAQAPVPMDKEAKQEAAVPHRPVGAEDDLYEEIAAGLPGFADAPEPVAEIEASIAPPPGLAWVRSQWRDGVLVVELRLTSSGYWSPGAVEVWQDGVWVPASVVAERTTADGPQSTNTHVMLAVKTSTAPSRVRIDGQLVELP